MWGKARILCTNFSLWSHLRSRGGQGRCGALVFRCVCILFSFDSVCGFQVGQGKGKRFMRWGQVQGQQAAVRQVHMQGPVVLTPVIPNPPTLGTGYFKPGTVWKPPDIWQLL